MNILLTSKCNRKCSYCFAQERISYSTENLPAKETPLFISPENFQTAIEFASKNNIPSVGILGGEPSMHPQFVEFLHAAWELQLHTRIFTNGLWRDTDIAALETLSGDLKNKISIVVNVNGPTRTRAAEQAMQENLLRRLHSLCSLSFNISRADFDPFFLPEMISTYGIRTHIRLGIAQPLAALDNEHIDISEYRTMVPTLLELAERCDEKNIGLGFDCGFIYCMFTEEELGKLIFSGARFKSSCGPAVDVGTDLSAWACFPLSTFATGALLSEFENHDALVGSFRKQFGALFDAGSLPECISCRYRKRNQCSGGCAAHVYRKVNP